MQSNPSIRPLSHPGDSTVQRLLAVWESAVRATHHFLSEKDIVALRPQVAEGLHGVETLCGWIDEAGTPQGFCGVENGKLEMLFVDAACRGKGVGGQLARYSIESLGVRRLDVNEQNPGAIDFYTHLGFVVTGRSPLDEQGNPFPLLHMALP